MSTSQPVAQHLLNRSLAVLALTAGVSISNIYYNQPLLTEIGESFPDDASWVGAVAASTQLGFAVGMVLTFSAGRQNGPPPD